LLCEAFILIKHVGLLVGLDLTAPSAH